MGSCGGFCRGWLRHLVSSGEYSERPLPLVGDVSFLRHAGGLRCRRRGRTVSVMEHDGTATRLAARIYSLMREFDLDAGRVQEMTGISRTSWWRKMRGDAEWTLTDLTRVADVFFMTVSELLDVH